jgi:hypothetical protein
MTSNLNLNMMRHTVVMRRSLKKAVSMSMGIKRVTKFKVNMRTE